MNFINIPLFNIMQQKLKYHAAEQAVLAQNVANADTPGYLAQDITPPDFSDMVRSAGGRLAMTTTNAGHMTMGSNNKNGVGRISQRENTYELNPIGNNVVIEEETMKVAQNQAEYQKTLSIYRKSIEMFRIALGRGAGA